MAYITGADEDCGVASVSTENACYLVMERRDVVTVSLLAEFAEAAEILPDLGRSESQLLAELKR